MRPVPPELAALRATIERQTRNRDGIPVAHPQPAQIAELVRLERAHTASYREADR